MKQGLQSTDWRQRRPNQLLAFAAVMSLLVLTGVACNSGAGSDIPNVSQNAEELPLGGVYSGPPMDSPRYAHTQTRLIDGRVLVAGGSDERLLTSLDTAEIYDQSIFVDPPPESIGGGFISTDFNGDPIVMLNSGRLQHAATLLPSGNVLITGGSTDQLIAECTGDGEIFDVPTREFAPDFLAIENEMVEPRFRHTATLLPSGDVLIVGGQITVDTTIIDTNFAPGEPQFQVDVRSFPSTDVVEIFRSSARRFEVATDINNLPTELVTPRGRTGHGSITIAGPDLQINTSDDYVLFAGGFQTLSQIFAPPVKFRTVQGDGLDMQTAMEVYNPTTGSMRAVADVEVEQRAGIPSMVNLGLFRQTSIRTNNPLTPGADPMVPGVNNMFVITNGDSNGSIPGEPGINSQPLNEVMSTVFTGAGPNDGILVGLIATGNNSILVYPDMTLAVRSEVNSVLMPCQRFFDGQLQSSNWVISSLGFNLFMRNTQLETETNTRFITVYDPFLEFASDPIWDQSLGTNFFTGGVGNQELNPTGVTGTRLLYFIGDGVSAMPNDLPPPPVAVPLSFQFARTHTRLTTVAGVDGAINTFDDRLVAIGGGSSWLDSGGEPVSTSCEVFVPFVEH